VNCNPSVYCSNKSKIPIFIDSGASQYINPIPSDFKEPVIPMYEPIQGLSEATIVKKVGIVRWNIKD